MHVNQQSTLVESTLRELWNRNGKEEVNIKQRTVVALLFFHIHGMDKALKDLKHLHKHNIRLLICPDETLLKHYDVSELAGKSGVDQWIPLSDLEQKKEQIDFFYIPVLPFATVSDLLHFNDTRASIRLLLWAMMRGKKISACSAGADSYHSMWSEAGLDQGTPFLKREMKKQLQQISGYGIQFVEDTFDVLYDFQAKFQKENKQVITAEVMQKQVDAGIRFINSEKGTIITPLARDIARKYQIKIRETRGKQNGNGFSGWQSNGYQKR